MGGVCCRSGSLDGRADREASGGSVADLVEAAKAKAAAAQAFMAQICTTLVKLLRTVGRVPQSHVKLCV